MFLHFAIYIAVVLEILCYFLRVAPKGIAEGFKRVVLLVSQKHVYARHEYVWVLWQIFHNNVTFMGSTVLSKPSHDTDALGQQWDDR